MRKLGLAKIILSEIIKVYLKRKSLIFFIKLLIIKVFIFNEEHFYRFRSSNGIFVELNIFCKMFFVLAIITLLGGGGGGAGGS